MLITALIIDDEKRSRELLFEFLPWGRLGIQKVLQAEDGLQALTLIHKNRPQIVITDIRMPHMNGIDLAHELKKSFPSTKLIFLSGYPDKEYLKDAIKLQAISFIEKPIDLIEIETLLKSLVVEILHQEINTPQFHFFRGDSRNTNPLSETEYSVPIETILKVTASIQNKEEEKTCYVINEIFRFFSQNEGTDREHIRHIFTQITLLFMKASELYNIREILGKADYYFYTAPFSDTLLQLQSELLNLATLYFAGAKTEQVQLADRINKYLDKNYMNSNLTLHSMSIDLGYVHTYLCSLYKKNFDKTINQQITNLRILRAKKLLKTTDLKFCEISLQVGYTDAKYFTKVFSKQTTVTPKNYREGYRNV